MVDFESLKKQIECSMRNNKKFILYLDSSEKNEFIQKLIFSFANVSIEKALLGILDNDEMLKICEAKKKFFESKVCISSFPKLIMNNI